MTTTPDRSPASALPLGAKLQLTAVDPATGETRVDGEIDLGTIMEAGTWNLSPKGTVAIVTAAESRLYFMRLEALKQPQAGVIPGYPETQL